MKEGRQVKQSLRTLKYCMLIVFVAAYSQLSWSDNGLEGRKQVVLEGKSAVVSVDIAGGSIVDFHLSGQSLNPLHWNYPETRETTPRPMGHFVCFDRWGQPSVSEEKNGMPFHGEATKVVWKILRQPSSANGNITAEMSCALPIGGMSLKRTMSLKDNAPIVEVTEEITNNNKLGRVYNIVQHPSIGPPFLDETVIIDCNALKGFMSESIMPNPEEPTINWPANVYRGKLVDLRYLTDDPRPGVTSFVFRDGIEYGWVTACNPGKGLLLGYRWKLSEYPWLNIWRNVREGKPAARGIEFGTTGLHRPFGILLEKHTMFGRPLYEYLDAGESVVKTYTMFLAEIPSGCLGVTHVVEDKGKITITIMTDGGTSDIVIEK